MSTDSGRLSPREVEVIRLIAEGKSNKEIAMLLGITVPTVKGHVGSICLKLGAANRAAAAVRWVTRA